VGETPRWIDRLMAAVLQTTSDPRADLVVANLGLVRSVAARFFNCGEPIDDLRQAGAIGLLKAAARFDDKRGVAFTTYARAKIEGEILHHRRDKCYAIRLPRRKQALAAQVEQLEHSLASADRGHVSDADIASRLGVSERAVRSARDLWNVGRPLSLDAVKEFGSKPMSDHKALGRVDPDIEGFESRMDVSAACATLEEHERVVVRLRFFEELTQRAIGKMIGKSQMYVCRVQKQAIDKLRSRFGPRPSSMRYDWGRSRLAANHFTSPFGARRSAEG